MFVGKEKLHAALLTAVMVNAIFVGLMTNVPFIMENARANQGGPDLFGYLWTDSNLPGPAISYNWVEISTIPGTDTGVSYSDDGGTFSMGFSFDYYGNSYTDVNIYSHGYIDFGPLGSSDYTNEPIPSTNTPNSMIAAYWDDLIGFGTTGGIYSTTLGSAPNRMYVVQWNTTDGVDAVNFEIILHETSNNITMQYRTMDWDGSDATVGIEDETGSDGLEYSYNMGVIFGGLAIRYFFTPPDWNLDLSPGFDRYYGYPTWNIDYILTITNTGINDDTYDLSSSFNLWPVSFRDIITGGVITNIFVASGTSEDFIARTQIPGAANPGDLDWLNATATSQGDSSVSRSAYLQTMVPHSVNWQEGFEGPWNWEWIPQPINPGNPWPTEWQIGDPMGWGPGTAFNGTNCSGTNIDDDYYMYADVCFISPYVELGLGPQILGFYHWYEMDTYGEEGGFVEISVAGGPWNQIDPIGGYSYLGGWIGGYMVDAYSGLSAGWEYDEFDLSAYAGQVVQVRFHFASDNWGWQSGWYIDDVYMGSPPPFRVDLWPGYQSTFGMLSTIVDYIATVDNTGSTDDTYDISSSFNLWPVTFRDSMDTMDITTIFVASQTSEDFIVRVAVPAPGVANPGDIDYADITVKSQGDGSVSDTVSVRTQVPHVTDWSEDFESGWGGWTENVINEGTPWSTYWQMGDPSGYGPGTAYNGTNCVGTNINDDYYEDVDICLISPYIEIGSAPQILTFYNWYEMVSSGEDGGFLEISVADGPWNQIDPVDDYPYLGGWIGGYFVDAYSGSISAWEYEKYDLSAYAGLIVKVRFHFASGSWYAWQPGWYIDEVFIGALPPYEFDLLPNFQTTFGVLGTNVDYVLNVNNTGTLDDTYDLSASLNLWTVTFRDIGDTMDISTISVSAGTEEKFIARVSVPGGSTPGTIDRANITATSQGDSSKKDTVTLRTQTPYKANWFYDFEGGWDGWTTQNIDDGSPWPTQWQIGDPLGWGPSTAYNGSNCAGTNIADDYYNNVDICLVTPYVELGTGAQHLGFFNWYEMSTMGEEGGFVEISVDDGPWNQIDPIGGYPYLGGWIGGYNVDAYSGILTPWGYEEFDLSAYSNQVVRVRFHFASSPWWGWQAGWYIDSVYIGGPPPFGLKLGPVYQFNYGFAGSTADFVLTVKNTGADDDTYDLSSSLNMWTVTFRDIGDTMDITSIFVPSGNKVNFLARVSVPGAESPGNFDDAQITATSQGDPLLNEAVQIRTQVPYKINYQEGFESGWGLWDTQVISEDPFWPTYWEMGNPSGWGPGSAYNGSNCAGTNIWDWYYWDSDICLISPYVEMGTGMQMLSFYQWYVMDTDGNDGGFVEISANNGPWTAIRPMRGYPFINGYLGGYQTDGYSGYLMPWTLEEFDLSAYSSQVVRIRFHFASSPWWGWQDGWFIDDVYMGDPVPYRCSLKPDYKVSIGSPGTFVDYTMKLKNIGANADTYDLGSTSIWPVTFRDIGDTTDISSISLSSGQGQDFLARVMVPPVPPGAFDIATLTATSQNYSLVSDNALIDSNVPVSPPVFDDLESGMGPWRTWDNLQGTSWQLGDPSSWPYGPIGSHSPTNCWGTNIVGNYTTDAEALLTSPFLDLRIATSATLSFWHYYDINGGWNDGAWVEVSDDFGKTWTIIDPIGGYPDWDDNGDPCYAGTSVGWEQAEFDLVDYLGSIILGRFHLWDYQWDGPIEGSGWYIDDVNVTATFLSYGVDLTPDQTIIFETDGLDVRFLMTATNLGVSGPDTFDLTYGTTLGWTVSILDLSLNPITSVGPLPPGFSEDFYVQVSIPGGTPSMTQENVWVTATSQNDPSMTPADDTSQLDTEVLAAILYVDDDGGFDTENEFTAALSAGGYEYNTWTYELYGPPDAATLSDHLVVVWGTGDTYDDDIDPTLSAIDRANIGAYLDNGGHFYLSSSMAAVDSINFWGGSETWTPWLKTYLHSDFNTVGGWFAPHSVNGTFGDPIGDGLDLEAWTGDYNPSMAGVWTICDPVNQGTVIFTENSGPYNIATKADTGVYRIVYTGFDLSTINGASNRTLLLDRILTWLIYGDIPKVIQTIPSSGASGVAVDQNIVVIFSETMDTGFAPVLTQTGGPDPGGWTFVGWSSTFNMDDTATWSHNSWSAGQSVDMSVSGAQDLEANLASGLLWSFTISSGATSALALGPLSGPTNIAGITITYSTTGSPASVDLYYTTNTTSPYTWTLIGPDSPADGSYGWTILANGLYGWYAKSPDESVPGSSTAPEASVYAYDGTQPNVQSTVPAHLDTGIAVGQNVIITFNEVMVPGSVSYTIEPNPGGLSQVWSAADTIITVSHNNFSPGTRYWVNITAGTDLAGNNLNPLPHSFYFDTVVGSTTATATGPLGGPTNVAGITITYTTTGSPASVTLYYTRNTSSPYSWTLIGTDNPADGSYGWTVPVNGLYGWYAKSPDESAPGSGTAPEASVYAFDGTKPDVQSTVPVHMDTDILVDQNVIITFDEIMLPGSVSYTIQPNPGGLSHLWSGGDTIITISHTNFAPGTRYWVNITAGTDLAGNNLNTLPHSFYFDTSFLATTAMATGPVSTPTNIASITITYTTTGSPATVDLYYTTNSTSPYTWTLIGTDNPADGSYPWVVPADGNYGWYAVSPDESAPLSTNAPEVSFYRYDATSPDVFTTVPLDLATGVPINQEVIITFDEIMLPGSISYTMEPSPGGLSELWSGGDSIITIFHGNFATGSTYWVNITAGTDLAGNNLNVLPYSFSFDTAATAAIATGPVSGPTNVAGVSLSYNTLGAPASVDLYYTTNTSAPYTWSLIGTDSPADGSYGWTIPSDGSYSWLVRSPDENAPTTSSAPESSSYMYDATQPGISSTDPINAAVDVLLDHVIMITFSEPMNTGSLVYTIEPNPGGLSEVWSLGDTRLAISHLDFAAGGHYWLNITAATDLAGNNLNPLPYSFYFDCEIPDMIPPKVSTKTPMGTGVSVTANIVITFDEAMNTVSVQSAFSFTDGVTTWTVADGTPNWNPAQDTLTFNPTANFDNSKTITVKILGSTAMDANGNLLDGNGNGTSEGSPADDYTWSFTTQSAVIPDTTPPISQVSILSAYQNSLTFDITYTASDSQSGVKEVELWYKKDTGGWGLYQTYSGGSRTVSFTADSDGVYYFYTKARDNNNNLEGTPSNPDTSTTVDTVIPQVVSVVLSDPTPTKAGYITFRITFSENMDTSVSPTITFGLTSPYSTHNVMVTSYSDANWTGSFNINTLTGDGTHTLKISLGEDIAGNPMVEYTLQFVIDTKHPVVQSVLPEGANVTVASTITITFDEAMNTTSVENSFSYTDGTSTWTIANGTASWSGNTMTFTPSSALEYDTEYTVTFAATSFDLAHNGLSGPYSWTFTTVKKPDTSSPFIKTVSHTGDDAKVTKTLTITFSEAMDHSSVENAISISPDVEIESFTWSGNTLTIHFTEDLEAGTEYTVTVDTTAEDAQGTALEEPYSWSFTPKEAKEDGGGGSSLLLILLIVVIVVVLLLFLMMKKMKPSQQLSDEPQNAPEDLQNETYIPPPEGQQPSKPQDQQMAPPYDTQEVHQASADEEPPVNQ